MTNEIHVIADIVRGKFNYGFDHTVKFADDAVTIKAIVDRYNLVRFDMSVLSSGVHFTKPRDLSYSLLIVGDSQPIVDFLKNPPEPVKQNKRPTMDITINSVNCGDAYDI